MSAGEAGAVRLDRWLWAARLFKTRSLAKAAVEGGKVHLNGDRVKPARAVRAGDRLRVTRGVEHFEVEVRGLAERRGPAVVAQALYAETEASRERREREAERRRSAREVAPRPGTGRPSKRDRRALQRLRRKSLTDDGVDR